MTSRPLKYIVRKLVNPEKEDRVFHADEVHDHTFDGFGLYWEADAVARCLRGERPAFKVIGVEKTRRLGLKSADGLLECPEMTHAETSLAMEVGLKCLQVSSGIELSSRPDLRQNP
jgi:dihydrodiol dehydrogenase / D-xylose 1-dehydrogenase (NADP)